MTSNLFDILKTTVFTNAYGDKYWYQNGELHREDGPAIEFANGTKYWFAHGKLHRVDGPAMEYADGEKSWYLNGIKQHGK
jgi:hypothetical protein